MKLQNGDVVGVKIDGGDHDPHEPHFHGVVNRITTLPYGVWFFDDVEKYKGKNVVAKVMDGKYVAVEHFDPASDYWINMRDYDQPQAKHPLPQKGDIAHALILQKVDYGIYVMLPRTEKYPQLVALLHHIDDSKSEKSYNIGTYEEVMVHHVADNGRIWVTNKNMHAFQPVTWANTNNEIDEFRKERDKLWTDNQVLRTKIEDAARLHTNHLDRVVGPQIEGLQDQIKAKDDLLMLLQTKYNNCKNSIPKLLEDLANNMGKAYHRMVVEKDMVIESLEKDLVDSQHERRRLERLAAQGDKDTEAQSERYGPAAQFELAKTEFDGKFRLHRDAVSLLKWGMVLLTIIQIW